MQNGGWVELFRLVPEKLHDNLIVMMADGSEVAVQDIIRLEAEYVVLRGRVAGTSDTGLAFFLPYEGIVFVRLVRPVPEEVVYGLYGMTPPERKPVEKPAAAAGGGKPDGGEMPAELPDLEEGAASTGTINRKELLDRLRSRVKKTTRVGKPPTPEQAGGKPNGAATPPP
jgi:hypothetical protein